LILYYMQELLNYDQDESNKDSATACMFDVILPFLGSRQFKPNSLSAFDYKRIKLRLDDVMHFENAESHGINYAVLMESIRSGGSVNDLLDDGQIAFVLVQLYSELDSFLFALKSAKSTGRFSSVEVQSLRSMFLD
jgi:pyruvate kinase